VRAGGRACAGEDGWARGVTCGLGSRFLDMRIARACCGALVRSCSLGRDGEAVVAVVGADGGAVEILAVLGRDLSVSRSALVLVLGKVVLLNDEIGVGCELPVCAGAKAIVCVCIPTTSMSRREDAL
jgi:hypothetical protein